MVPPSRIDPRANALLCVAQVSRAFYSLSRDGELWPSVSTAALDPTVALSLLPRVVTGFTRTLNLDRAASLTDAVLVQAIDRVKGDEDCTCLETIGLGGE